MTRIIIDRFEGDMACVEAENGKIYNIPLILLPNTREGDVIDITVNREETQKRSSAASNRLHSLFEKGK